MAVVVDGHACAFLCCRDMNANEKIRARYRAREAQAKANEKRCRRDRANADDAATIRVMLHRVGAVDSWERKRLDQAAEHVRADAAKRRASYFSGLQAAVDQMRDRGQRLAAIATLVEVDVREIQAALRRARTEDTGRHLAGRPRTGSGPTRSDTQDVITDSGERMSDAAVRRSRSGDGARDYDPNRCIRCDAVMLDAGNMPRRGRRRLYCSDTCRRDASAARTAAERYGSPIRVVEVPRVRAESCVEQNAENAVSESSAAITPRDAADITLENDEALHALLARVTEQARLKKLNRATLTAARELAKAVHPHRTW
ncbi:MAG: hypothetical protein QOG69_258 [Actinomycetota bacterium]|nr:hypothetical protein [Actinomycetota bacterium]